MPVERRPSNIMRQKSPNFQLSRKELLSWLDVLDKRQDSWDLERAKKGGCRKFLPTFLASKAGRNLFSPQQVWQKPNYIRWELRCLSSQNHCLSASHIWDWWDISWELHSFIFYRATVRYNFLFPILLSRNTRVLKNSSFCLEKIHIILRRFEK